MRLFQEITRKSKQINHTSKKGRKWVLQVNTKFIQNFTKNKP